MDGRREGAGHHRLRTTEQPDHLMRDCGAVSLHCLFCAHCHPTHIAERRSRANDVLRTAQGCERGWSSHICVPRHSSIVLRISYVSIQVTIPKYV